MFETLFNKLIDLVDKKILIGIGLGLMIALQCFIVWQVTNHIPSNIQKLDKKIDKNYRELNNKIDEKFDGLETKMDEKFDALFFYLLSKDPNHLKPVTNK